MVGAWLLVAGPFRAAFGWSADTASGALVLATLAVGSIAVVFLALRGGSRR
jgi:hypothetical protein